MIMYLIFAQLLALSAALEFCLPYGVTASIGYYYTYFNNQDSEMLTISFNTNHTCSGSYVNMTGLTSLDITNQVLTTQQSINMSGSNWTYSPVVQRAFFKGIRLFLNIEGLIPGQDYEYIVSGPNNEIVGPYTIRVPKKEQTPDEEKSVIFFGDFDSNWYNGNKSQYTFEWFINQSKNNRHNYDLLILGGDVAYDLESENCQRGDYFFRNLSTFSPYWPLLLAPGNHDAGNNSRFPIARKEFYSPEQTELNTDDFWLNFYGFDLGLAHFINFHPYWLVYEKLAPYKDLPEQRLLRAMRSELEQAQNNRENVPWIVIISHYPMYCSGYQDQQCYNNFKSLEKFEELFKEFKVDLYIGAHQHSYERDAPTYRNQSVSYKSTNGDVGHHLVTNPGAPVYIVEGAAGNAYYMPPNVYPTSQYTVAQSVKTGVGILHIYNRTHLGMEHIAVQNQTQEDYFYIVKTSTTISHSKAVWISVGISLGILVMIGLCSLAYCFKNRRRGVTIGMSNSLQIVED